MLSGVRVKAAIAALRRGTNPTSPSPVASVFEGKLTPCYEQSRKVVCYSLIVMPSGYICLRLLIILCRSVIVALFYTSSMYALD